MFELLEFKVVLSSDLAFKLLALFFAELYLGVNVYLLYVLDDNNFLLSNSGYENLHSHEFITELLVGLTLDLNQTFFVLNNQRSDSGLRLNTFSNHFFVHNLQLSDFVK